MLWFTMFVLFILVSMYTSYYAFEVYHFLTLLCFEKGFKYWIKLIMYEEKLERWLSFYWCVWFAWFVPRFFWGVTKVQTHRPKLVLAYLVTFYVAMFFIFYIFWSFVFWFNLNVFVDYSVFSINLFLIFFFNFVYSIFFKLSSLESKVSNLLS